MENAQALDLVLIVGAQKSGTSSLFDYLSAHEQALGSVMKQTFYFMSPEFYKMNKSKVPKAYSENVDDFLSLFPERTSNVRVLVESTPDYLHFPDTIKRIKSISKYFRNVFIIGVLRHPVDRFISWHRFAIQQGTLRSTITLKEYLQLNRPISTTFTDTDACFFAKESGEYSKFLSLYTEAFGRNLKIYSFDQLKSKPQETMNDLCRFIGITPEFYEGFQFNVSNKTVKVRSRLLHMLYMYARRAYILLMKTPFKKLLGPTRNTFAKLYHRVNEVDYDGEVNSTDFNDTEELLLKFYSKDIEYCNFNYQFDWKARGSVK
ncbi:sulfotransferase family protein [Planctobacterium marinum]|uniref:Sulfotransferase domain-containing protein n=1 Tax=Planctobacterium marinum TaxID=1631968 RepID=A0AA48HLY8_9ALTE|nr:hypothetical protein MACH26_31950 [Planctobacterium marinum]